jgi:hypothetical protein
MIVRDTSIVHNIYTTGKKKHPIQHIRRLRYNPTAYLAIRYVQLILNLFAVYWHPCPSLIHHGIDLHIMIIKIFQFSVKFRLPCVLPDHAYIRSWATVGCVWNLKQVKKTKKLSENKLPDSCCMYYFYTVLMYDITRVTCLAPIDSSMSVSLYFLSSIIC